MAMQECFAHIVVYGEMGKLFRSENIYFQVFNDKADHVLTDALGRKKSSLSDSTQLRPLIEQPGSAQIARMTIAVMGFQTVALTLSSVQ
jgi:hypothetical protein